MKYLNSSINQHLDAERVSRGRQLGPCNERAVEDGWMDV